MEEVPLEFEAMGIPFLPGNNSFDHNADFGSTVSNILNIVMVIALLILLVYLIFGAFEWMTSGGDSSKLQKARDRMLHAIVGILILSSTLAVFMFIQYLLGVEIIGINLG
ncbi:MAG: hypothetical protein QG639_228 [Patescibacteria group bacterium]|nr:hypothetical protein [Patescibacteria group bacterium]